MELKEYKKLLQGISKPTDSQTKNFIEMVSNHHSWYKHLTNERLTPFIFFIDPNAGKTIENTVNIGFFKKETRYTFEENSGNNYQSMYGNWQYLTLKYTENSNRNPLDTKQLAGPIIITKEGKEVKLPEAAIKKGVFMMSKFLHKNAFEKAIDWHDEFGVSYAERHKDLMNDLREHLDSVLKHLFDEI